MRDGSVGVDHRHPKEGPILEVVDDAQNAVTGNRWTHIKWYAGGATWECTFGVVGGRFANGMLRTSGLKDADLWREPIMELSSEQVGRLVRWSEVALWTGVRYNLGGLVAFAIVYPTRWLWERVGIVPFESSVHRAVCSVAAARAFVLGADVAVWKPEEISTRVPGDFAVDPFWRDV